MTLMLDGLLMCEKGQILKLFQGFYLRISLLLLYNYFLIIFII